MSSLIPSLIVIFQGISKNMDVCQNVTKLNIQFNKTEYYLEPTKPISYFSVSVFFFIIFVFTFLSLCSFILLNSKFVSKQNQQVCILENSKIEININTGEDVTFLNPTTDSSTGSDKKNNLDIKILLLVIFFISFFMYGVLPGLQSYSTLSYSHSAFNLSINLGNLLLPFAVFFTIWSYKASLNQILVEFFIGLVFAIYIVIISFYSPCPPLVNHWLGAPLIVTAWILTECIFIRLRCVIASKLEHYGDKTILVLGIVTLVGQMTGGVVVYVFVDIFRIFKHRPDCVFDYSYCR